MVLPGREVLRSPPVRLLRGSEARRSHAPLQPYQVGSPVARAAMAMDYFTKWPEPYAVLDKTAATTIERLISEVFYHFGETNHLAS